MYENLNRNASVKVLIPTFNGAKFIAQTLDSILAQTLKPEAVVVIDDGSTDETFEIVTSYMDRFAEASVRFGAYQKKHRGIVENFCRCIDLMQGHTYYQILHQDDVLDPDFYAVMVPLLEDCDGVAMAWCLDRRIDENGHHLSLSGRPNGKIRWWTHDQYLKYRAELGNQAFCATLIRTDRLLPVSFSADLPVLCDMLFWAELSKVCSRLVSVNRPLASYRWHGGNATIALAQCPSNIIAAEYRVMDRCERMRNKPFSGFLRRTKLQALFLVRSYIKIRRVTAMGWLNIANDYRVQMLECCPASPALRLAARCVVALRDWWLRLCGRSKHPANLFS